MAEAYQITDDSVCPSCTNTPAHGECVKCFMCKLVFHAICEATDSDTKLGTHTMIKAFSSPSTKNNFKFFCNNCLTVMERNLVESETEKIDNLEKKFYGME